jgi:DNA-binding response OmpR family regulator
VVDATAESLRVDDQPVGLSQAEFRIFARLWESRGRIVTAEDLMGAIYGQGERPASRVLPVFLFKLRRKLSPLGLGDLVETAIGRGFTIRGDAEVEAHA